MLSALSITIAIAAGQSSAWDVNSIFQRSLEVSPVTTTALQRVVEARARLAEVSAQRLFQPVLNGTASHSHGVQSAPPTHANFQTYTGTLTIPFPNHGRLRAQQAQAQAQLAAAQAGLTRARLDLAFRASDAYYAVLRARGVEQIAQQTFDQAQRQVADAQKRVEAGEIAPAEVLKAQVPEAQARAALARAKNQVRVAEETLNSFIRQDMFSRPSLADAPAVGPLTITREAAHAEAIRNSPDVIEADANVRAAEAAIAEARRVRDPDLSVQASHAHTTDPTTYSDLTTLNLSMDLPLGGGTVARQQLKQAQAMLEQAKATREIALQSLDLAVEQAFLDFEANLSNVESAKETVRIAEESYQKAVQAYAAGLTTTRDVLDAGFALATARNDLNTAVYDLALSRAKLDQVIGREPKP